jgi:hypothetical protein
MVDFYTHEFTLRLKENRYNNIFIKMTVSKIYAITRLFQRTRFGGRRSEAGSLLARQYISNIAGSTRTRRPC